MNIKGKNDQIQKNSVPVIGIRIESTSDIMAL